jgi:hypothetical protein
VTNVRFCCPRRATLFVIALPRATLRLAARAAAAEARRRADGRHGDVLTATPTARFSPIRRAADIPEALDRLVAMIRARSQELMMHETGAALQAHAYALKDAADTLHITARRCADPDPLLQLAAEAEAVRERLVAVAHHRGRVMTIGPVDREPIAQADQFRGAMRTLRDHVRLIEGRDTLGPARVSAYLVTNSELLISSLVQA